MTTIFNCPECGHDHGDPADASFVLAVLCLDCETAIGFDARATGRDRHTARTATSRAAA